jgi:hypothetical protein
VTIPIVPIVIVLCIVGVALWGINSIDQIAAPIKKIINVLVVVVVLLWLLSLFTGYGPNIDFGARRR